MRFTEAEYSVPFYGRLWSDHSYDRVSSPQAAATHEANYFAQVATAESDGTSLDLSFAVEGQSDASTYQTCHHDEGCTDVTVRVTPEGLLYLHADRTSAAGRVYFTHLGGFAPRAVEVSAADAGSTLKVYREVVVDPPAEAAGCEDYGDGTPDAFTCLFLRELLPPGQAADLDEAALRAKLPKLVQDSAYLKHSGVEMDIFEMSGNWDVAHQYANWSVRDRPETLLPLQAQKWVDFCRIDGGRGIVPNPGALRNRCKSTDSFTVTRGMEWTPRGYRTYIWVHGLQDGLTLIPKNKIGIFQFRNGDVRSVTRSKKSQFFENLVRGDASTLLEQAGIAHVPMPLYLNTWSFMVKEEQPYIRRRLTFDYVRVWQPENHYSDMEPVYQ